MLRRLTAALLTGLLALPAAAAGALVPFSAEYTSNYGMLRASGTRMLSDNGDGTWLIEHSARLLLVNIAERSVFTVEESLVKPLEYRFANPLSSNRSTSLHFDWAAGQVTETDRKSSLALEPRVFDKLSYQIQLKMDVCAAPETFKGAEYTVVDRDRLKRYRITPVKSELLDTKLGQIRTLRLRQVRADKDDDEPTYIWLAPDWHCLLVRVDQLEDDKLLSLKLVNATVDGKTVEGVR